MGKNVKDASDQQDNAADPGEDQTEDVLEDEQEEPQTAAGDKSAGDKSSTVSQEEHNKQMGLARQQGRTASERKILKDLGVETLDEAKVVLDAYRKQRESELSDLQKAQEELDREKKRAGELAEQLEVEKAKESYRAREDAIADAAGDVHNVRDLVRFAMEEMPEDYEALLGEEGVSDSKVSKKIVDACKKKYPHYFKSASGAGSPSSGGGKPPEPSEELKKKIRPRLSF